MLIRAMLIVMLLCSSGWAGIDLTGDADRIQVTSVTTALAFNRNFTVTGWIKTDANSGAIIGHGCSGWYVRLSGTAQLEFLDDNVASILASPTLLGTTDWHHFALTVDNSSPANVIFYVDGANDSSTTTTANFSGTACHVFIGAGQECGACGKETHFNGKMAELALWQTALSANEVYQLAHSRGKRLALQINKSNLVSFWPLDEGATGAMSTISGFYKDTVGGYNGTLTDADGDSLNIGEPILTYP